MSQADDVFSSLLSVLSDQDVLMVGELSIPTKPVPASRPRVSRWGTYYGKNYTKWRDQAEKLLAIYKRDPVEGSLAVVTEVILPRPKTTARNYPRGDNDNYEKAIWDSVVKAECGIGDDDQIVLNITYKRFCKPGEEPGVCLTIYLLET